MRKKWLLIMLVVFCLACSEKGTEKHQGKRDNVFNVSEKLTEIEIVDVLLNMSVKPYIVKDYLVILDPMSDDKLIHIFDKFSFRYITSFAQLGRGPGEISNIGPMVFNENDDQLLVLDANNQCVFAYNIDSLLSNPLHFPYIKARLDEKFHIGRFVYFSDTLSIGEIIESTSNSTFRQSMGKWNITNGTIEKMPYEHPNIEIDDVRFVFAVSKKYGLYINCYNYHDLMTICSLDGELKYNIYGDKWDAKKSRKVLHYGFDAAFCGDYIIVSYSGENNVDDNGSYSYPTKFLVFDIKGNYLKTLETGYSIYYFCYDEETDRLIMSLDDEMQLAYLNLHGLL